MSTAAGRPARRDAVDQRADLRPVRRDALDTALAASGLTTDPKIRVRRSWDPFDPDSTSGSPGPRRRSGEFAYTRHARATLSRSTTRGERRTSRTREPYPTGIHAACNKAIKADLAAALQAVVDAGLAGAIDVANANTYGGCFGPRFSRIVGTQLGTLSRHTWAQALDTNTRRQLPGLRAADGLPRRAHLPRAQLRVGRQLPHPRRHALRVGRRAAQHLPVPVAVLPQRAERRDRVVHGQSTTAAVSMFADDGWALAGRLSAASLSSRWQLDS